MKYIVATSPLFEVIYIFECIEFISEHIQLYIALKSIDI